MSKSVPYSRSTASGLGFFLAAFLLTLLHGCQSSSAAKNGQVELTVWSMWSGQEERNFTRVLQRFEQLHPHIHIRNLGAVSDDTKTVRALVAGAPPDVFTLSDPAYLGALARNHAVRPLDAQFQSSGLREADFVSASLRLCRYDNHLYGMPFLIDDVGLLWDKAAFREVGLDPEQPPRTLEQLADYAVKLTRRDANGSIVRLGMRPPGDLFLLFFLYGGKLVDPQTGRITADDPGNSAGLAWYKNLVDRLGGIQKINAFTSGFGASQGANNPFYTGKVAMMLNGEWNPNWLARYAPQVQYGVAPVPPPAARPERAGTTWIGGNVFCIPTDSKHPQEAWELLAWMQSSEAQTMFAKDMNNVPNMRAALHSPELRMGAPFRQRFGQFLDLADSPNGAYFPALPVASLYINQLGNANDKILYGEATPAQALARVRERVQNEMDRQ